MKASGGSEVMTDWDCFRTSVGAETRGVNHKC